ncbi:hypothetical protein MBLNU457_1628t1 [Dothideomycetes sp. NU457]
MPHAVDDQDLQDQRDEEAIARMLDTSRPDANEGLDFLNRDLEIGEKDDDAVDYEDISDGDLASDEDEGNKADVNGHEITNGHATDLDDEQIQETDFGDDLFGDEDTGLPMDEDQDYDTNQDNTFTTQPAPKSGLALPSQHRIALPGATVAKPITQNGSVFETSTSFEPSASARAFAERENGSDLPEPPMDAQEEEELDEIARLQRELFAMAGRRGSAEPPDAPESAKETFYTIWPGYDPDKTPRFIELFPPMRGIFNWKTPLKPPKQLQPTKLSLDLQQDTERSFRLATSTASGKASDQAFQEDGLVRATLPQLDEEESEDDIDLDEPAEFDMVGNVSFRDIALLCEDWDVSSVQSEDQVLTQRSQQFDSGVFMDDFSQPNDEPQLKRRKTSHFDIHEAAAAYYDGPSLDDPEYATERLSKRVALDLNDPHLLIDEAAPKAQTKRRNFGAMRVEARNAMAKDLTRRYNISNDAAYDLLKENHQHKVRSTLGGTTIEHSRPAVHLQFPFYRVKMEPKQLRSFHRPTFDKARSLKENRFSRPKKIKRKEIRGLQTREIFAKAEDLSMGDNSNIVLLEYAEERPIMLSNFGMGNRLINFYRRKDDQDNSRPKLDIGETSVLLPQDRSPFANFGQINPGETVPAIQNSLYRAPIFKHEGRSTDFLLVSSSTFANGTKFFLRNIENLHVVGQQFPSTEVPGEHSRKVTSAAKDRLKAISYRIWKRWAEGRSKTALTNEVVRSHLPGSDIPQNRGKMREFMAYDKVNAHWIPKDNGPDMTPEQIRAPVKPEDVCILDSMQVGVQHLTDLGLRQADDMNDDDDDKEGTNIEVLLAPWATTKNFMNATQGKAMLQLHGEGDPTGRGEGFSFIKTSMKGGFRALGESIEERLDAKKLKENNGHSYNVAKQQRAYDESIRRIWRSQQTSLSSTLDHSDAEADPDDEPEEFVDRATPRPSFGTSVAGGRREDESVSQFSRNSSSRKDQILTITRKQPNSNGAMEDVTVTVTNPRVIAAYQKAKIREKMADINPLKIQATGDAVYDAAQFKAAEEEILRLQKNIERSNARKRAKGIVDSPSAANSPAGDGDNGADGAPTDGKPKKGRKKQNTEGTGRRCANCGQIGHIKTNKKWVDDSVSYFPLFASDDDLVCEKCKSEKDVDIGFDALPNPENSRVSASAKKKRVSFKEADAAAGAEGTPAKNRAMPNGRQSAF